MPWSQVTAGGSATTWSAQTAGGSDTTWSGQTAGGSSTTWSGSTAGGSSTTWSDNAGSRYSFGWIPYSVRTDLWGGSDFIPHASTDAPYKSQATDSGSGRRPIAVWDLSTITSSAFTAERQP